MQMLASATIKKSMKRPTTNIHTTEIYAEVVMEKKVDAINLTNGLFG